MPKDASAGEIAFGAVLPHEPLMRSAALLVLLPLALSCGGDEPEPDLSGSTGDDELREIVLDRAPRDSTDADLFGVSRPTVRFVLQQLELIAETDSAKGLYLRVGNFGGAWGRVADLQAGLAAIREAGKPVHCHFDATDNAGYALLAASCDRISMTPGGVLDLVGVSVSGFYARELLERIGARADILHVGRYKGAGDTLTRDDMPPEARESLGALREDLQAQLVGALAARASQTEAAIEPELVFAHGVFTSNDARSFGLVDDVGFDDEGREHARQAAATDKVRELTLRPPRRDIELSDIVSALSGQQETDDTQGDRVALVYLSGNIMDGSTPRPGDAVSGPFVDALRDFARDDEVKAIVLRVNSPGGSALASDRMWHAVRRAAAHKPVIASIGDVAASGGYYIACGADAVYAHPASIVGSIGVVGGKVSFGELADDLGVNAVTLRSGPHSDWSTPLRPFDEVQRAAVQGLLRSTYWRFVRRVAVSREMEQSAVHEVAQGRVMSGARGHAAGLVDELGGLDDAIARAVQEGGLEVAADAMPEVEVWPKPQGVLESLTAAMGGESASARWQALLRELGPVGDAATHMPLLLDNDPALVSLPYVLQVR